MDGWMDEWSLRSLTLSGISNSGGVDGVAGRGSM